MQGAVVVVDKINRFLVKVCQQLPGDLFHANFGVSHRRSIITIEGPKIPLTINQRVTHIKILRHAHDRVVGGGVTVWVILTNDIANYPRGLHVGPVKGIVQIIHGEQNPSMYRLQAVSNIRQSPANDDTHRVVEIRLPQFVFNINCCYMLVKI